MTTINKLNSFAYGFYVVDEVGRAGILAGPFKTSDEAESERHELNIGEDCGVWERDSNGQFKPVPWGFQS